MEKVIVAKLDNGVDSCLRVLTALRNRRFPINSFNLSKDNLSLAINEDIYNEVHLYLSRLADINLQ